MVIKKIQKEKMIRKFKVWDKGNKKWIDDTDIAINQKGLLFIRHEGQVEFSPMSLTKSENFEVVYSIGLEDNNGEGFYNGDIVRFRTKAGTLEEDTAFIKWSSILFQFILIKDGKLIGYCDQILEKIGSIYKNSNNLKGGRQNFKSYTHRIN